MTENKLWSFALTVYQRDAVAPACLDLQEQCQIDVPLMLCAVFACLQGKAISDEDLTQLFNLAGPWQSDIVQSLYIRSEFQRRGFGRAAMRYAQSQCDQLWLWVFQSDRRAQSFYRSLGFQEVETSDGRDNDYNMPDVTLCWRQAHG